MGPCLTNVLMHMCAHMCACACVCVCHMQDKDNEEVHLEWKQGLAQRRKAEELAARMAEEVRTHTHTYIHTHTHSQLDDCVHLYCSYLMSTDVRTHTHTHTSSRTTCLLSSEHVCAMHCLPCQRLSFVKELSWWDVCIAGCCSLRTVRE